MILIHKDLSSDKVQKYRSTIEKRFNKRTVDEVLLQRAWQTAYKLASTLYEDFGATQVAVFGSLTQQNRFSKYSDIDIAVWGIPKDKYLRALSIASDISGLFKVGLVDFDSCNRLFQERIKSQLISIEKGAIYEVDRRVLIQRITDELKKISETATKIEERLEKIKSSPAEYREYIEITIAKNLVDCYQGMENIFRRIALDVDLRLPDGSRWHKDLLDQMAEPQNQRQPVISQETFERLQELLEFRHVFNNIYGEELLYERTEQIAKQLNIILKRLSNELDTLIANLKKQEND